MLAEGRSPEAFRPIRDAGDAALEYVHTVVGWPGRAIGWSLDAVRSERSLRRELAVLRAERLLAQVRLQRLAELTAENARLRGILDSRLAASGRLLLAEVVRTDPNPALRVLVLDRGARDGVAPGLPVLDAVGVMGQVTTVTADRAEVMLLSDRRHGIAVRAVRSGARGVLQGAGDSQRLELAYVPESADLVKGDQLVSSGLGVRFPAGLLVGSVTDIFRSGGGEFAAVGVRPAAGLDSSRHVVVLLPDESRSASPVEAPEVPHAAP